MRSINTELAEGGVLGCSGALLLLLQHAYPPDGTTKCLLRFGRGGGDIIGRRILLPLDGDFVMNESSNGGGVEIVHLFPAHADHDDESLSAAGLEEGALFGLTSIVVVNVVVVDCMKSNWIEESSEWIMMI